MPRAKTRRREAEPQIETTKESTGIYQKLTQKGTNTEGMKQVLNALAEQHNHIRNTWLDRVEKDMADALHADGLSPDQRDTAPVRRPIWDDSKRQCVDRTFRQHAA